MDKVIPSGINYADLKPEAIENQIRMIKFLPISNVQNQKPNDVVRFHLQGNGFFDPYSAYIKIRVSVDDGYIPNPQAAMGRDDSFGGIFLDRSAHSLINRLVIRSQGTELERIEQYDVMAAMVNDIVYSYEYKKLHSFEGFGYKYNTTIAGTDFGDTSDDCWGMRNLSYLRYLNGDGPDPMSSTCFDRGHFKLGMGGTDGTVPSIFHQYLTGLHNTSVLGLKGLGEPFIVDDFATLTTGTSTGAITLKPAADVPAIGYTRLTNTRGYFTSPREMEFCIPIYSGIIGVFMPDKKLLPLSLMPLEVEFTLNPQAFYPAGTATGRQYTIKKFEIWTHTLFFEYELHRSLEAVVAESGIFIHYNSFYLTPINYYNNNVVPRFNYLGIFLKSVEALHWVFLYSGDYILNDGPRKLHFVSHNISNVYLRNGMDLIPSEPIPAINGGGDFTLNGCQSEHNYLLIETLKGWNKMHDPLTDCGLSTLNYRLDSPPEKPTTMAEFIKQGKLLGKCQYALSLVGEEIGQNKTIISGKKTVLPFDLNFDGKKQVEAASIMLCFLRADFIIYVRPDLIVTRLGL